MGVAGASAWCVGKGAGGTQTRKTTHTEGEHGRQAESVTLFLCLYKCGSGVWWRSLVCWWWPITITYNDSAGTTHTSTTHRPRQGV